ncbi:hypothetical protein RRG08_040756 [Elysia crispata]|uniref:Uncharacterized protein n=1 Tax=Elysia crispata TaxID=231223 RepID=A0AAE1BDF4_9GAST|nr:hypothetical protein RRG08_040756 [Elysia crispata]
MFTLSAELESYHGRYLDGFILVFNPLAGSRSVTVYCLLIGAVEGDPASFLAAIDSNPTPANFLNCVCELKE